MRGKKLEARLEIRLDPQQLQNLKDEAAAKGTSVADLVREAISTLRSIKGGEVKSSSTDGQYQCTRC